MDYYDQEPPDPSPDFVKGFNEGYILAQVAPEIGGLFGAYAPETERGKGFRHGKEQVAYEDKSTPNRESLKDHRDNQESMGVKQSVEDKKNTFQQAKQEQNLSKQKFPNWLQDRDDNQADMGVENEPERDTDVDRATNRDKGEIDLDKD